MFSFPRVLMTKYHKLGGFEQRKFMALQFWRIKVHNQSVSRTMFPLKDLGKNLFHAFSQLLVVAGNLGLPWLV